MEVFFTVFFTLTAVVQNALDAYDGAKDAAEQELSVTHPIRLGLALNFSVFYYEIKNDPAKARELAKKVCSCSNVMLYILFKQLLACYFSWSMTDI